LQKERLWSGHLARFFKQQIAGKMPALQKQDASF
jgi:hypothetical protein